MTCSTVVTKVSDEYNARILHSDHTYVLSSF
jgi:hypothetical protein